MVKTHAPPLQPYLVRLLLLLLFPLALALAAFSRAHPGLTEAVYSRRVYPVLSWAGSRLTQLSPLSVAELLLCAGVLGLPVWAVVSLVRSRGRSIRRLSSVLLTALSIGASAYFLFWAMWGLNYNRLPLEQNLGYKSGSVTEAELTGTLTREIDAVNSLVQRGKIAYAASGSSYRAGGLLSMERQVQDGYNRLATQSPLFNSIPVRPKGVLLSWPWCYTGTEGIFIPFTYEPCVNTAVPAFMQPFDMSHECAHFRGFAKEDEANFVGFLAATANSDVYFQYSGHMAACIYLSNALYDTDEPRWEKVMAKLDSRAHGDFRNYNTFWAQFAGPVQQASQQVNNGYLESNGQPGVVSYSLFVELLAAQYRTQGK